MRRRVRHWVRATALGAVAVLCLSGCASALTGEPSAENAPNSTLSVTGADPQSGFDQTVKNALSDVMAFWKDQYPTLSGGKPLEPLKGGLFSVDGLEVANTGQVSGAAAQEGCIAQSPSFIIDNGAFCVDDDSIAWDRAKTHLFAQLAKQYGSLMVALIFAHEFGHAISYRLGIFKRDLPTIDTESQADCAAGAWAASALKHQAAHFVDTTPEKLDDALEGFLDGRDSTPGTINEISHGNGFDRLSALADGLKNGVKYCYSDDYFKRTFTERPFSSQADYDAGGNQPLSDVIDTSSDNGLVTDLNRFWTAAGTTIKKTFKPVKLAKADHPKCGGTPSSEFGYCPSDNTVYFSDSFAKAAYNSLPGVQFDQDTGNVTLVFNQPADFALGEVISIGWGLAVRHQFFGADMDTTKALKAAVCYTGAYAKGVNIDASAAQARGANFYLSPSDLDEAVSALLDLAGQDRAFGARGTTGLDRVQAFNQGYKQSLSSCNY